MNTKKSRAASVLSIIYNVASVPFWGYFAYVMMIFLDLGIASGAEFSTYVELLVVVLLLVASSLLGVVNFVMAIVSFSFVGKKSVKYDKGKKFIITYIVLMFIQAACNFALAIFMLSNIILAIATIIIALLSLLCATLYLVDYTKSKKAQAQAEEQVVEESVTE